PGSSCGALARGYSDLPSTTLFRSPFVYALALDQGVLHPQTVLRDAPTSFGPFMPENFDGRFVGPMSAEEALIRSRNVPAVWVALDRQSTRLHSSRDWTSYADFCLS